MNSRRHFIKLVLLSSGAAYSVVLNGCTKPADLKLLESSRTVYDTPKFGIPHAYLRDGAPVSKPARTVRTPVAVIGTGIAGLSAAAFLNDHGIETTQLESEFRPGGAAVSAPMGGFKAPLGSVYFTDLNENMQRLLDRAGVHSVHCPADGYNFGTGEVVRDIWTDATLDRVITDSADRDGMKRFRDHLLNLRVGFPDYPLPDEITNELVALDIPAYDWVKSFGSRTLLTILNSYSRSSMGAMLERVNVYNLINFYSGEFGDSFGLLRHTFPGGTSVFAEALAASLPNVTTSHVAVRVANSGKTVDVDCIDSSGEVVRYICDQVVVATPKFQVPHLIPELDPHQAKACSQLSYAPYITIHVVSSEPFMEPDLYDTWNLSSEFETDVVNPASVPGSQFNKHISSLYVPVDRFARSSLQDPELFARRTADIVDRFLAAYPREKRNSVIEVYSWGWGHGMVIPFPGSHSGIVQAARRSVGNIHFASADNDAAPAIENAISHGYMAAMKIVELLQP